jgi:two-component system chemotaxis response regulator CheB
MRDIVVVGTSAGGIQALRRLVAGLSPSLPAAVIVVMHLPLRSELVRVLTGCASFPVHWARDRMPIARHNLHLAPPDHQLSVDRGFLRVDTSPKEGVHRPSINLLFRSAAAVYGQRVIGVILTGHPSLDRATDIRASFGCNQPITFGKETTPGP